MNSVVAPRTFPHWLPGVLLLAAVLWLMRDTASGMVEIWSRSETFTHGFLVPPIALWLAWRRRAALAVAPVRPAYIVLLPMAAVCFVWLLGELATVAVVTHFALTTLIVLSVPALFGWAVARILAFPLGFLYFAVPFGEFTQPVLMDWTADFTVAALRSTGIPVYREGLSFVIPSGNWSVVEACSGVRYLIASFMVGTLFAYLNYQSMRRRLIFMGVAILVPIVANWLRAYMIVMIGHLSGNELAVGVDHLIYGWVFFGLVIGLMFFVGARWAEPDPALSQPVSPFQSPVNSASVWRVALGVALLVGVSQWWGWRLNHHPAAANVQLQPAQPASPWVADDTAMPWAPAYSNPSAVSQSAYRSGDQTVWVWIGYYRDQDEDRKLVTSVHRLEGDPDGPWFIAALAARSPGGSDLPVFNKIHLQSKALLGAGTSSDVRVWQTYWTGERWETSVARTKVWQALGRLAGEPDDGAVVLLATADTDAADATLAEFARRHLIAIGAALQQARYRR